MSPGRFRDVAPELRARLARGVTLASALAELRSQEFNALEVLKALREVTGAPTREAAELLRSVPEWRDSVESIYRSTEEFLGGES